MAAAGVAYHVGREARSQYDENGTACRSACCIIAIISAPCRNRSTPIVVPGDPTSGLLPRISAEPPGEYGAADNKVQAYCFRMCLTNCPENRVPFPKPAGYDPTQYELLLRVLQAGWRETFEKFDPLPNRKTDTNNHGPFSTDNIGRNYDYPEADYARRREIIREHETYQQGLDVLSGQRSARARRCAHCRERSGGWPGTNSSTTDIGPTNSTFAKRAAWSVGSS